MLDVMHEEMRDRVVLVQAQDRAPADVEGNRPRDQCLTVDPVALRLSEAPVNLERDADGPRARQRHLEAASEPVRALLALRGR